MKTRGHQDHDGSLGLISVRENKTKTESIKKLIYLCCYGSLKKTSKIISSTTKKFQTVLKPCCIGFTTPVLDIVLHLE